MWKKFAGYTLAFISATLICLTSGDFSVLGSLFVAAGLVVGLAIVMEE